MRRILALCVMLAGCGGGGGTEAPAKAEQDTVTVFIGDSITAGWAVEQLVPGAVNAGVPSNSTSQMLTRFDADVLSHHPAVVVILGGTNDLPGWEQRPELDFANPANIFEMAQKATTAGARVIVGTITPTDSTARPDSLIRTYNQRIKDGAAVYGYTVVDYYTALQPFDEADFLDGLHPNGKGYEAMWKTLAPAIAH
jgi:lysophospholipase L1-like esterase